MRYVVVILMKSKSMRYYDSSLLLEAIAVFSAFFVFASLLCCHGDG